MVKVLFDTNILIDYLLGIKFARLELQRYSSAAISLITWIEVIVGETKETENQVRAFLNSFERLPLTHEISENVISLRKKHKIRLPDAIIWATAQTHNLLLVTRNTKDFPADSPSIRVPYRI